MKRHALFIVLVVLLSATLACSVSFGETPTPAVQVVSPTAVVDSAATEVAAAVKATMDAQPSATPQPTVAIVLPTAALAQPTEAPTVAMVFPSETPAPTEVDFDALIKGSKILLYEDMAGSYDLGRIVNRALNQMGLAYTDTKDYSGDFKTYLTNGTKWDLIILASELRSATTGEFYDYLGEHLDTNTAVVLENWNVDAVANGRIRFLLDRCGVAFQADWYDPQTLGRSLYWLDVNHPLLTAYNSGLDLLHPRPYWTGDAGDLLIQRGSENVLVAGTYKDNKSQYGTIAACEDGIFIIQTFSTHDYPSDMTLKLWQNYIYYTLQNHYRLTLGLGD